MKTIAICLPEYPSEIESSKKHFDEAGVGDVHFMWSINAPLAGIETTHTYEIDHPGSGYRMGAKPTGIWIAHIMAWTVAMQYPDEHFMILEADAKFLDGWKPKLDQALKDVPSNFDMLFPGHACLEGHPRTHIAGDVYDTKHCQTTHCYIVRRGIIPFLLKNIRKCWAPIDCELVLNIFPKINVYAIIPRIVEQHNTIIPP